MYEINFSSEADEKRIEYWFKILKKLYPEPSRFQAFNLALIDRDFPDFGKFASNPYVAMCEEHLSSIIFCYPYLRAYSIPPLIRSMIEICVKHHHGIDLNEKINVPEKIRNSNWDSKLKEYLLFAHKCGNRFIHSNVGKFNKKLEEFLNLGGINNTSLTRVMPIENFICFLITLIIDLINLELLNKDL